MRSVIEMALRNLHKRCCSLLRDGAKKPAQKVLFLSVTLNFLLDKLAFQEVSAVNSFILYARGKKGKGRQSCFATFSVSLYRSLTIVSHILH